jgi:predicted glycosyltransferase
MARMGVAAEGESKLSADRFVATRESDAPRFLFYSHDGLGLGHIRRNLAIARAVTDATARASIVIATSAEYADTLGLAANVDLLRLPALRKLGNGHYAARRLPMPAADVSRLRSELLAAAVKSFAPDVLLVDKHPLGVYGELELALDALDEVGGRAVVGLRDILDEREAVAAEWAALRIPEVIAERFDRVLVYGDAVVLDPILEYGLPEAVAAKLRFCGYVSTPESGDQGALQALRGFPFATRTRPLVLATAGGGEDGVGLLEAFVDASAGAGWDAIVVAGPQAANGAVTSIRRRAVASGAAFRSFVPQLAGWFGIVDALVCMGGYNTLTEAVSRGTPTVCVPRVSPRREQLIRAEAFGRLGLIRTLVPDALSPGGLRAEIELALSADRDELARRAHNALDFDGARRAARNLLDLAYVRSRGPSRVSARPLTAGR